jgi:hypothetical protein
MSHTTSIKGIKLMDIKFVKDAVAELAKKGMKISVVPDAVPRAYYANQQGMGKANFVIKLDDAKYDIGLYKQDDGSYEPRTDFFGGSVQKLLGVEATKKENTEQAKIGKLIQLYGIHAATDKARKQGLTVRRVEGKEGAVKLVIAGYA